MSSLQERMQMATRRILGKAILTEKDINDMAREIRLSLLEADVNFQVVIKFVNSVKEKALGQNILKGLNPGQQVVKVVYEQLKETMGSNTIPIVYNQGKKTIIMVCGLQGSGKTTSIAKLAMLLRKNDHKKPLLIAGDIYRPAAIDQLITLGKQLNIEVYEEGQKDVLKIVKNGLKHADDNNYDLVIIDTAGRLHIDDKMMEELVEINKLANPSEILLTVDAMTGQDAANISKSFAEKLPLTGAILTKMDGDTRGGAALSVVEIANIPIKFMTSGEKLDTIEIFHPDRVANRILGMGDTLTLIEKVADSIDEDEALSMMEKLANDKFNYNDLLKQFKMMKKMGSMSKLIGFIPGIGKKVKEAMSQIDEKEFYKKTAIISSMTEEERKDPKIIEKNFKRRQRIANGSGMKLQDVNSLQDALKTQVKTMKQMMNMDEDKLKELQKDPSKMTTLAQNSTPKQKKGKGKNKGRFRY